MSDYQRICIFHCNIIRCSSIAYLHIFIESIDKYNAVSEMFNRQLTIRRTWYKQSLKLTDNYV